MHMRVMGVHLMCMCIWMWYLYVVCVMCTIDAHCTPYILCNFLLHFICCCHLRPCYYFLVEEQVALWGWSDWEIDWRSVCLCVNCCHNGVSWAPPRLRPNPWWMNVLWCICLYSVVWMSWSTLSKFMYIGVLTPAVCIGCRLSVFIVYLRRVSSICTVDIVRLRWPIVVVLLRGSVVLAIDP